MILVFSSNIDPATLNVVKWLRFYGAPFVRINSDDKDIAAPRIRFANDLAELEIDSRWISLTEITAVWYRKGSFWRHEADQQIQLPDCPALSQNISGHLHSETKVARDYFHYLIRKRGIRVLGNPTLGDPNKLIVLDLAGQCGLDVPAFQLTDYIGEDIEERADTYITKPASNGVYFWDVEDSNRGYFSYTEQLSEIPRHHANIPLSFIQKKIEKKYEVRSFFLDGKFISSAIFSQLDAQTKVDYRKYNYKTPNRNVPYVLPADIEQKLAALFRRLELNTGSVDILVDDNDRHYFLEINPTGQYGGISERCNFCIDKLLAEWLMGGSHESRHA